MRLAFVIAAIAVFTYACNSRASDQDYKDSIEADRVADSLMRVGG